MSLFAITTGSPRTPSPTATLLLCWLLLGFAVIVLVPEVKQRFVTQAPGLDQVFDSAPYLMGWRNEVSTPSRIDQHWSFEVLMTIPS